MRKFVAKHATQVTGTLSCFDRLLFKGHLPLGYPHAMEQFLTQRRVLMKDLKVFVLQQAARLKGHAAAAASRTKRKKRSSALTRPAVRTALRLIHSRRTETTATRRR